MREELLAAVAVGKTKPRRLDLRLVGVADNGVGAKSRRNAMRGKRNGRRRRINKSGERPKGLSINAYDIARVLAHADDIGGERRTASASNAVSSCRLGRCDAKWSLRAKAEVQLRRLSWGQTSSNACKTPAAAKNPSGFDPSSLSNRLCVQCDSSLPHFLSERTGVRIGVAQIDSK